VPEGLSAGGGKTHRGPVRAATRLESGGCAGDFQNARMRLRPPGVTLAP
jgi:hypothetical protein